MRPAEESAIREVVEAHSVVVETADAAAGVSVAGVAVLPMTAATDPASGDSADVGDVGRGVDDDVERGDDEAPRRLRSMRLAASRPAKPRVAQRLGRGASRGSSPLRAAKLQSRTSKPRRGSSQMPSHLQNLARRDLAAAGFTGILPNPDVLDAEAVSEGTASKSSPVSTPATGPACEPAGEIASVQHAPMALALPSRAVSSLLEDCAGVPWIWTRVPALDATPAVVRHFELNASPAPVVEPQQLEAPRCAGAKPVVAGVDAPTVGPARQVASDELAIPDALEDPMLAAFFDLPGFAHLKDVMDVPPPATSPVVGRRQPHVPIPEPVEPKPAVSAPAETSQAAVGLRGFEDCGACSRMFRQDWLACPHCGEVSTKARLEPSVESGGEPGSESGSEPGLARSSEPGNGAFAPRVVRPSASQSARKARVVRPRSAQAASPASSAARDRSALWIYVIGGLLIAALVLFLCGLI